MELSLLLRPSLIACSSEVLENVIYANTVKLQRASICFGSQRRSIEVTYIAEAVLKGFGPRL
jgi:hypothetical protein